jgi:hypothetical protein
MHDARRDEPSALAGPESLDFVVYEIDNNGHNGSHKAEASGFGENGHSATKEQLPSAYRIGDSDADGGEPSDDWQECIAIAEHNHSVSETKIAGPAPEVEMIAETPEIQANPVPAVPPIQRDALPVQQDALPVRQDALPVRQDALPIQDSTPQRSNSSPALGSISDLLKTRPASMQQPPQPLPIIPDRRPVEAQPRTTQSPGGNGGSRSVEPAVQTRVPLAPRSQLMGGTQLINLYEQGQRDFSGANLRQANLRGASLQNSRMIMADLLEADLSYTDLTGARLIQANLGGSNMQGTILTRAKLTGANLNGADLRNADLEDADLSGVDLRGADLLGANLLGARLTGANLENARLNPNWELVWQIVSTEGSTGKTK